MCHDQRQRIRMRRADVDEVDLQPVNGGQELGVGVELGFSLAPVMSRSPVTYEFPNTGQPNALRSVSDRLTFGPASRRDAPAQFSNVPLRDLGAEWPDSNVLGRGMSGSGDDGRSTARSRGCKTLAA